MTEGRVPSPNPTCNRCYEEARVGACPHDITGRVSSPEVTVSVADLERALTFYGASASERYPEIARLRAAIREAKEKADA